MLNSDMTIHRFEQIVANVSFSAINNPAVGDRWSDVKGFVREISRHRHATVIPGK